MCRMWLGVIFSGLFLEFITVGVANGFEVTITDGQRNVKDGSIHRKVGQQLLLNCSITPNIHPQPLITWYKNDSPQFSSNTSDQWLVNDMHKATSSDGGYYKCEVKSQKDVRDATVVVNMEGKPLIIDCCGRKLVTGNPMIVQAFEVLLLNCYGTGWPKPTFRWLYKGVEMKEEIGQKSGKFQLTHVQNGLRLMLPGILKKSEGDYTCEARNSNGTDKRILKVIVFGGGDPGDPIIKALESNIHAKIGQTNVTLSCIGERVRKMDASTEWKYNERELDQENILNKHLVLKTHYYDQYNESVTKKVQMSLTINNVTKEDHGNYTCTVSVLDQDATTTILLRVGENDSIKPTKDGRAITTSEIIALTIAILIVLAVIFAVFIVWNKRRKNVETPKIPEGTFKYDAFITYSSQDYAWVKENLLPLLKDNGIETCIHYRNFELGVVLEQNMVNLVYKSRVVLVVMSKNYMKSKYCRSELEYAIHRSVEEPDSNSLITLRIDKDIKESKLPKAIRIKTFLDVASDLEKDTWKKRLVLHVKSNDADQNRNVIKNDKHQNNEHIAAEQDALLDPSHDNIA